MSQISSKLLRWYDRHGRDLPWRKTRDPYKILVSEIMLQQTQVDRVLLFYKKWLKRFPTWKQLADASTEDLLNAWAGLGYNRRALMLRQIAQHVRTQGVPQSVSQWQSLKGIGVYTSTAICVFSLGQRLLPIDTNIRRVLGRVLLGVPYPQLKDDARLEKKTDEFLSKQKRFTDIPQALFDLATNICKKVPDCTRCPLRKECKAASKFLSGNVRVPKQMIKKAIERHHRNKPFPDRIYRGRILKLVRESKHIYIKQIGSLVDPDFKTKIDSAWIESMVMRMVHDGLIMRDKQTLRIDKKTKTG